MSLPFHLPPEGCLGAIANISLQLPADVLQNAELQGSQRQLRQRRLGGGRASGGPAPPDQPAAVDLSLNLIADLRGNLMEETKKTSSGSL